MLRSPLLHFLVLGALLFGVERASDNGRAFGWNRERIEVSADDEARVLRELQADLRHVPSASEREAALNQYLNDEVMVREALRLGLDQRDSVVRSRLIQNMRFAAGNDASADDAELLREAQQLRMDRSDLVVRRRLVQLMERRLAADVRVDDTDVQDYLVTHTEDARPVPRLQFVQAFVSADRHPQDLDAAARRLGQQLSRDPAVGDAGEPFLLGRTQAPASVSDIAARYGQSFAETLAAAPRGVWSGPIRSPYGLHFVRVEEDRTNSVDPAHAFAAARYALLETRQREALRAGVIALRARYVIERSAAAVKVGDAR